MRATQFRGGAAHTVSIESMSSTPSTNPLTRFSDRVEDYRRHRPGYPDAMVSRLRELGALPEHGVVADVGSGTGISAGLFLRHGCTVFAVEPNAAMRRAAEEALSVAFGARFHSVDGRAEATGLDAGSVDLVLAAQAFHWFDREGFRRECRRILRPGGQVAVLWNDRRLESTPFLREYEALLREYGTDYCEVAHRNVGAEAIAEFFRPTRPVRFVLENVQRLDLEGLLGRTRSSSYVPAQGDPRHRPMMEALRRLFDRYARAGVVEIEYDVVVHLGTVADAT